MYVAVYIHQILIVVLSFHSGLNKMTILCFRVDFWASTGV